MEAQTVTQRQPSAPKITRSPDFPDAWSRVVIYSVRPRVDCGRWPVKRARGESVEVVAGVIADGHEQLSVELLYAQGDGEEHVVRMALRYNDEYTASFTTTELGTYRYRIRAWINQFATWQDQFRRRVDGGAPRSDLDVEMLEGAALLNKAVEEASGGDRSQLAAYAQALRDGDVTTAIAEDVAALARLYDPHEGAVVSEPVEVVVDPELARFAAWYEFFPRSAGDTPGEHATLDEAAERLPRIKELGFDIVYLPPIHPIGTAFRKGKDNTPDAAPGEPGSPWAIGAPEGGHKSVHPDLGGIAAFDRFVARADELGLKVALDIAFQASPDHPYVKDHPEWFKHRPDGSIRYAENPPKKYQDIYPINFESEDWQGLWQELRDVFAFWIDHGVRVFRVDNPHTKPFAFWAWCLPSLRAEHPELIFLSEAFTRPKTMYTLARLGFNNSYTYFTWRNTKAELQSYCEELFQTDVADFFRPNFWPNTPDILHDHLVHGGRPAHVARLVLAATLSSAYGVYGPPFEHVYNKPHPEREEYADNEKYELRTWNWNDPYSLQPLMRRINQIRRRNPALQHMRNLRFHEVDNPFLMAYSKVAGDNLVLCVVNLDPHHTQSGWLELPLEELGLPEDRAYKLVDLLGGGRYAWTGPRNFVLLNPHELPAHVFRLQRLPQTVAHGDGAAA